MEILVLSLGKLDSKIIKKKILELSEGVLLVKGLKLAVEVGTNQAQVIDNRIIDGLVHNLRIAKTKNYYSPNYNLIVSDTPK